MKNRPFFNDLVQPYLIFFQPVQREQELVCGSMLSVYNGEGHLLPDSYQADWQKPQSYRNERDEH